MRVTILRGVVGPDGVALEAGKQYDVGESFARALFARRAAVPVDEADAAPSPEVRDPRIKRTR